MEDRRILAAIIGLIQSISGILLGIIVVLLFFNIFEIRVILNVNTELLSIYLMGLGLFGIFSIINGFFLVRESRGII
jgi:hypothetical protein